MGISIKIADIDRTEFADARSLKIIDELTSRVNSCSFDFICNDIALTPIDGQTVLIEDGATKLFSGRVLSKEESFLPPSLLKYKVECIDYTRDLDKKLVFESYKNCLAGNIIKHIVDTYLTGFTYTNVANGYVIPDISFDYVQVSEAITKIAEICGYEWYIDYNKDIHFFALNTYTAPFDLDDNQTDHKDLVINADISQLRNRIYVKSSALQGTFGETFIYDGETEEWICKFAPINRGREKLPDPEPAPTRDVFRCDFSHDDIYLAMSHDKTVKIAWNPNKGIYIYKRYNDSFTQLNYPDITPDNDGHDVSFSPDSTYLAVVHKNSPYLMIYKRSEDTFTKLEDPIGGLPAGDGWGCNFSPDGVYLAVAHINSPYITIYKRSGDVFSKLANPVGGLPAGDAYGCKFSPDGVYLAVAHKTTPFITIYKRSGDTFTKLDNPVALPTGQGLNVAWTPDSVYLAVGHEVTPFITVYKRADDVFTKIADPAEKPTGASWGVDFSPDGIQLAVAHSITPFVTIYTRSGDTLGKQVDPTDLPGGDGKGAVFSHNGNYLAIGYFNDPDIIIYKQFLPTIKVDGVIKTIGWDGIDNPLYYDFMLNEKTKVLSIGAAGTTMITIGNEAIDRSASYAGHYTNINLNNPANASGKIKLVDIFAGVNMADVEVATFFNVGGNNYSTRDTAVIGTIVAGSKQRFSVDLDVIEGDFIGLYWTTGELHYDCTGAVGLASKEYDHIPCVNQEFTPIDGYAISIKAIGSVGEGELTIGSEILVSYTTIGIPICFKREDDASIAEVLAIEGGDGIVEFCLVDNNINSIAWADDAAKADLLQNSNPTIEAIFLTNRDDIRSGQIITLNSIKRNINQQFIVQKVELIRVDTDAETTIYAYRVTIANKFKKLEDLFIYLLNKSDASLAGAAAAPGGGAAPGAGVSTFLGLTDTPVSYAGEANKFAKVNAGETALEFAIPTGGATTFLELTDTPASYTGKPGQFLRVNPLQDAVEISGVKHQTILTDSNDYLPTSKAVYDFCEVTKNYALSSELHTQNTDTDLDATFEATFVKKTDTVNVLSDITSAGIYIENAVLRRHIQNTDTDLGTLVADVNMGNHKLTGLSAPSASGQSVRTTATITEASLEDAISKKHTQNTDTFLDMSALLTSDHNYSGLRDYQLVGESVVFGDLLYFNWTDKEWKKADADAAATMPGLRIALQDKPDGQYCNMLVKGYIRDDSAFNFTGAMVYASVTPGAMSSTAPTGAGDQVQRVGVAKSADILFFDPSIDVGEI